MEITIEEDRLSYMINFFYKDKVKMKDLTLSSNIEYDNADQIRKYYATYKTSIFIAGHIYSAVETLDEQDIRKAVKSYLEIAGYSVSAISFEYQNGGRGPESITVKANIKQKVRDRE